MNVKRTLSAILRPHVTTTPAGSSGFTLVELVVSISILAVLATIGFLSVTGYSSSARDGSRVSDVVNLSKSLDFAHIQSGSYPMPDNAFSVTYSGGVLWYQGTASNSVMSIVSAGWARLSKKPTDPLMSAKEFTYSTLAYGKAYQIKVDYEGNIVASSGIGNFVETASAAPGNPTLSYIKGNYNGIAAKTQTGGVTYLIATPSIVTGQPGATGSGFEVISALSNKLLVHGFTNSGGITYTAKLIYASGWLPSTDAERLTLANGVASAYSGTVLADQSHIQAYVKAAATGNASSLSTLGGTLLLAGLGGSVDGNSNFTCAANPVFTKLWALSNGTPTSASQAWTYSASAGNCTYGCIEWYTGSGCSIVPVLPYAPTTTYTAGMQFSYSGETVAVASSWYGTGNLTAEPGCGSPDIAIWQNGTNNVQIWSACNVGATVASAGTTTPSCNGGCSITSYSTNYSSSLSNFGGYYQWGNNGNIGTAPYQNSGNPACSTLGSDSTYSQSNYFYYYIGSNWCTGSQNDNAWGITTNTAAAKKGPCQLWYHVPGVTAPNQEWQTAAQIIAGTASPSAVQYETIRNTLKIPFVGNRNVSGTFFDQGRRGDYWTTSLVSSSVYYVSFTDSGGSFGNSGTQGNAFAVRCIRN